MRKIDTIHIHHSAIDDHMLDNIEYIDKLHRDRGWDMIGYNYFISMPGKLSIARPLRLVPASIKGHNKGAVAICCGGLYGITFQQRETLSNLVRNLVDTFNIKKENIVRHKDLAPTECPSFDIAWLKWEIYKEEYRNG